MSNKYVTDLLRKVQKQGAKIENEGRNGGRRTVYGPNGKYIVHMSPSGSNDHILRGALRRIGFDV